MNMTPPSDNPIARPPTADPMVLADPVMPAPSPSALQQRAGEATRFLKSLANETRLMILCHLAAGERTVGELERLLDMRQPSLSQQLAKLREDGLVQATKRARHVHYRLSDPHVIEMMELLYRLFCDDGFGACRGPAPPDSAATDSRNPV